MDDPIDLDGVTVGYDGVRVLGNLSLRLPPRRITVLAGPNGCGKSTLLRTIRRLLEPQSGTLQLGDEDLLHLKERELARRIALLGQSPSAPVDLTVFDLVRLGRFPHQTFLRQWSAEDALQVDRALAATGVTAFRDRRLDTLSGGQRQRVWIAMVLAQDAPVICLDEPINHLDLAHQLDCLDLLRRLNREHGRTVIAVLHDINLAARYADHLVLLKDGTIHAQGSPHRLVTAATVDAVFGVWKPVSHRSFTGARCCSSRSPPGWRDGSRSGLAQGAEVRPHMTTDSNAFEAGPLAAASRDRGRLWRAFAHPPGGPLRTRRHRSGGGISGAPGNWRRRSCCARLWAARRLFLLRVLA